MSPWPAIYPDRCALCERTGHSAICEFCRAELGPYRENIVPGSGNVAYRAVLFDYGGRARQAVHSLKYERDVAIAEPMAILMSAAADDWQLDYDLAIPIPIHYRRRCERGFNQSDLLAEKFPAGKLNRLALRRIKNTRPQVSLTYDQRLENLKGAFQAIPALVAGKRILLLDDVATSGGTARAAAEALVEAGASGVGLIAFAGDI